MQIDLVTGKVQVDIYEGNGSSRYKSYLIKPLHSLVLDKRSGTLKNLKIPDSFYKYWQQGIYEFKNEPFAKLAIKIERIYGVKVIFEEKDLKECTFTGAFFVDSNIYTIMETFRRASRVQFEYSIDKNQIYLKREK
jgi:ferric-dicitrate binding protein FerR (iron transport regulator)